MPESATVVAVDTETLLRERVGRFLANHSVWKSALRIILGRIEERQWPAVVFGGVPRDLLVFGAGDRPRDVDIVISDVSLEEIRKVFSDYEYRTTRFGGVNLRAGDWLIDVWPLNDTWAFRELGIRVSGFQDLPKTTFLNVEAVAIDLVACRGRMRSIYSDQLFFDGICQKLLEINFEPNPFPGLCIIRSLIMASRLGFRIGPRLAKYISERSKNISIQDFITLQVSHYGSVRCNATVLQEWLEKVNQHVQARLTDPFELPRALQLKLWEFWSPTC